MCIPGVSEIASSKSEISDEREPSKETGPEDRKRSEMTIVLKNTDFWWCWNK